MILLQLPVGDILAMKSFTRSWNALINTSVRLRRATFHAPNGDIIRPLQKDITRRLPSEFVSPVELPKVHVKQISSFYIMPLFKTRVVRSHFSPREPFQLLPWIYKASATYTLGAITHHLNFYDQRCTGLSLSPAIRSMFITQPPVCAMVSIQVG